MNENFHEVLRTLYGVGSITALGYFLWALQKLTKDMAEYRSKVDSLLAEHETYKTLNLCPILNGAREHGNKTNDK
jgi:hypothetical protein